MERASHFTIVDSVAHADTDVELLEVMLAIASKETFSRGFDEESNDILHNNIEEDNELKVFTSNLDHVLFTRIEPCQLTGKKVHVNQKLLATHEQEKKRYLSPSANYGSEHPNQDSKIISKITTINEKINISKDMRKNLSHIYTSGKKLIMKNRRNLKMLHKHKSL